MSADRREAATADLVAISAPHERMHKLAEYQGRSAEWFYRRLARRLQSRVEPTPDIFAPPSAKSLIRHLRLPETGEVNWEEVGAKLLSEEGLEEAITRLSGLPRLLPLTLRSAWRGTSGEQAGNLMAALNTRLQIPVARLHLFHLCLERGAADEFCRTRANEIKEELLGERVSDAVYPGFLAILRWALELLNQWEETENLPPAQRLALSWAHAARVHDILITRRLEATTIEQHFAAEYLRLQPGFAFSDSPIRDDVSFAPTSWRTVLGRGLGAMAENVAPETATPARLSVHQLLGVGMQTSIGMLEWLPWIRETEFAPNALNSFLGGSWDTLLRAVLGDEVFAAAAPAAPVQTATGILEALENDPANRAQWIHLRWVLGEGPIHPPLRDRLRGLLEQTDFSVGFTDGVEDRTGSVIALAVCECVQRLQAFELRPRFEGQIIACMQSLRKANMQAGAALESNQAARETIAGLLHAARSLTVGEDVTSPAFYQLAARMIRAWPEAGTLLRRFDGGTVPTIPLRQVQGAWKYYLALRASP